MKKQFFILLICWIVSLHAHAQSIGPATINTAGGSAIVGTIVHDWSVGEMVLVSTFTSPSIIVTQGVLQPSEASSGISRVDVQKNLKVFPNPASTFVNLEYTAQGKQTLSYRLSDITGKLILSNTVNVSKGTNTEQINIGALPNASYILEVFIGSTDKSLDKASFKIEKLQ